MKCIIYSATIPQYRRSLRGERELKSKLPYQLDVTWDIGVMGQDKQHVVYSYFNLTDERMNQDHQADSKLPECKSKDTNCDT